MNLNYVGLAGAVVALIVAFIALGQAAQGPQGPQGPAGKPGESFGATPGGTFTNKVEFLGGVQMSGVTASTTNGSQTVTAGELRRWVNSAVVQLSPVTVAGGTITFPASSTIADILPKPGDTAEFCIQNATTTANVPQTIAGATGVSLNVASSSATALGSAVIRTGETGCIRLVRGAVQSAAYDLSILLTVFQ